MQRELFVSAVSPPPVPTWDPSSWHHLVGSSVSLVQGVPTWIETHDPPYVCDASSSSVSEEIVRASVAKLQKAFAGDAPLEHLPLLPCTVVLVPLLIFLSLFPICCAALCRRRHAYIRLDDPDDYDYGTPAKGGYRSGGGDGFSSPYVPRLTPSQLSASRNRSPVARTPCSGASSMYGVSPCSLNSAGGGALGSRETPESKFALLSGSTPCMISGPALSGTVDGVFHEGGETGHRTIKPSLPAFEQVSTQLRLSHQPCLPLAAARLAPNEASAECMLKPTPGSRLPRFRAAGE